jgi:hypothetical protein
MNRLKIATALSLFIILGGGCATKSDYVLPEDARKLTSEEITKAYTDARGELRAIDDPGLTAIVIWKSDGSFTGDWKKGWFYRGRAEGNWYVEGERICEKFTKEVDGSDLHCFDIYETKGIYTAVNSDGSIRGTFTLTPL